MSTITEQPIDPKHGIALLEKLNLLEYSVQAAICGDNGPLTSSPAQRRNMSLLMADISATLTLLAHRIDPLADATDATAGMRWEALRVLQDPKNTRPFVADADTPLADGGM